MICDLPIQGQSSRCANSNEHDHLHSGRGELVSSVPSLMCFLDSCRNHSTGEIQRSTMPGIPVAGGSHSSSSKFETASTRRSIQCPERASPEERSSPKQTRRAFVLSGLARRAKYNRRDSRGRTCFPLI